MKYIAAVSGGPDSMYVLSCYKKDIEAVCHINYKKRISADRDMLIVKNYCLKNNLDFFCLKVNSTLLNSYLKKNNNFQNAARLIRYDFFLKCARRINLYNLLIAHNKDDFLETALMQKKRKSKSLFLGIRKNSSYKELNICRPILNKWKSEILDFCFAKNITYGIDETNDELIYDRNVIRKEISKWSIIKKENKYKKIIKFNNLNKNKLNRVNQSFKKWKKNSFKIDMFVNFDKNIQKNLIYEFLIHFDIQSISNNKIENVIEFLRSKKNNTYIRLGNDKHLWRKDGSIVVNINKQTNY